jgi:hypothetical protein
MPRRKKLTQAELRALGVTPGLVDRRIPPGPAAHKGEQLFDGSQRRNPALLLDRGSLVEVKSTKRVKERFMDDEGFWPEDYQTGTPGGFEARAGQGQGRGSSSLALPECTTARSTPRPCNGP